MGQLEETNDTVLRLMDSSRQDDTDEHEESQKFKKKRDESVSVNKKSCNNNNKKKKQRIRPIKHGKKIMLELKAKVVGIILITTTAQRPHKGEIHFQSVATTCTKASKTKIYR